MPADVEKVIEGRTKKISCVCIGVLISKASPSQRRPALLGLATSALVSEFCQTLIWGSEGRVSDVLYNRLLTRAELTHLINKSHTAPQLLVVCNLRTKPIDNLLGLLLAFAQTTLGDNVGSWQLGRLILVVNACARVSLGILQKQ